MQPKAKHNKAQHINTPIFTDISPLKSVNLKDKCFKIRVQAKTACKCPVLRFRL